MIFAMIGKVAVDKSLSPFREKENPWEYRAYRERFSRPLKSVGKWNEDLLEKHKVESLVVGGDIGKSAG